MKKLKFSDSKKIVIKIGTSTITNDDGFDKEFLDKLLILEAGNDGRCKLYFNEKDDKFIVSDEYNKLVEDSKNFYQGSYGMNINSGHLVFSPEVVKESILEIKIKKKHVAE